MVEIEVENGDVLYLIFSYFKNIVLEHFGRNFETTVF